MKPTTGIVGFQYAARYTPAGAACGTCPAIAPFFIAAIPSRIVISGVVLIDSEFLT